MPQRSLPVLSLEQRQLVVATARTLLGVPFRHQGRTLRGIDCIGVLSLSFGALGYPLKDRIDYGKLPSDRKLATSLMWHFGPPKQRAMPPLESLRPGDVLTFSWGAEEAHVGLVVDHPETIGVIHAYNTSQKVVEHRIDELWRSRIRAVYVP